MRTPTLLVTLGDSGGLGPELAVRHLAPFAAQEKKLAPGAANPLHHARLVLVGARSALDAALNRYKLEPFFKTLPDLESLPGRMPGVYFHEPEGAAELLAHPGRRDPEHGRAAGLALETAAKACLDGLADGVVTLPLDKAMLIEGGFDFPGHTEFFAQASGLPPDAVTMHLMGDVLRVSLVTTHPRLRDVPDLITPERIVLRLVHTHRLLDALGVKNKTIAVLGLNPHAGESGKIGDEEIRIIAPAVEEAKAAGIEALGPLPGDSTFHHAAKGRYGAVLAMYHDQGLGPLKMLHFGQAVNVTLGLPFVRTSVDHGVGLDLVHRGKAKATSFAKALELALVLTRNRPDRGD